MICNRHYLRRFLKAVETEGLKQAVVRPVIQSLIWVTTYAW